MAGRKALKKREVSGDMRMYNLKEVAGILHLGTDQIRSFIKTGRLRAFLHFGQLNLPVIYVFERDLKKFLEEDFLCNYVPGNKKPRIKATDMWKK